MNEAKKCPKCGRRMGKGSEQTLDDAFRCTQGGTEAPRGLSNMATGFSLITVKSVVTSSSTKK